jgi:hypothetical protein
MRRSTHRLGLCLGGRLMPHEPPLIVAVLALAGALLVLLPGAHAPEVAAAGPRTERPTDATDAATDAPLNAPADGTAPTACPAPEAVASPDGASTGVLADPAGRFRFYGAPDPATGQPGRDSYDLVRGCAAVEAAIVHLNPVRVGVGSPGDARVLGPETIAEKTREARPESGPVLTTTYRLPGGLSVTQTLAVVRVEGRFASSKAPDTLRASYRLENGTTRALTANLSAVLAPARGPNTEQNSGVPYFANHPADGPGRVGLRPIGAVPVTSATVLRGARSEVPEEVIVPRPGATATATSYWRPVGAAPDLLVFASAGELAAGAPLPVDSGGALTDSSAFAALWRGLEIPARGSRTVSYEYGQASGWPAP